MAARPRAPIRGLGSGPVPFLLEQDPEVEGAAGMAPVVGPRIRGLSAGQVSPLGKHAAHVERGRCVPAGISATEGLLSTDEVSFLGEHHSQAVCAAGVVPFVSTPVRRLGAAEITSALEQRTKIERPECVAALV